MTIEGALPHIRPLALEEPEVRSPAVAPQAWSESPPVRAQEGARRPSLLRATLSVLHHPTLQNFPAARAHLYRAGESPRTASW